ncbi:MAG: hypothetical protein MN733_41275 [Nitrososphaera sp.]|nr:hypothetical protein [Nitrososphaera sp.]
MRAKDIMKHILATYFNLRLGMGLIGLVFPILLWAGTQRILESISAYYHTNMRDAFVGVIIAVGAFLYLYKGYSSAENLALNLAGFFALCVAIFPTGGTSVLGFEFSQAGTVHKICAVLFFFCLAYVSWFRASDTLELISDKTIKERYERIYKLLAIGMVILPIIAVVLTFTLQPPAFWVFAVEFAAIWVFAFYWLVKTFEISVSTKADEVVLKDPTRLFP